MPHNSGIKKVPTTRTLRSGRTSHGGATPELQKTDARLGRIVRLLMSHATVVVSGTKIADEISTSRSEVWRLVQQLRALGVSIAGHPATGYRLQAVPDLLLPDVLSPLVQGTIFDNQIHHYYKIGSTNTVAMDAASAGAPEGSVFLAERQTAGRGRGAHNWHSAQSAGIYCSVVLRPALPPSEALILSLAAGLAVRAAIQAIDSAVAVDLKWPNDLLINGKKVAGILTKCPNVTPSAEIDHTLKGSRGGHVRTANRLGPDHGSGRGIKAPQAALTSRGKEPPVFISERRPQALSYQIEGPEDRTVCGIDGIDL